MTPITTFRSPVISVWQSAIDEVLARRNAAATLGEEPTSQALSSDEPLMIEAVSAAKAALEGQPLPDGGVLGVDVADCAQLYIQLIMAQATWNTERVAELKNLISFSTCDPLWGEVFLEYEKYRRQESPIPYRAYRQFDDFMLPLPTASGPELKLALIADWGTGTPLAQHLLEEVAKHAPHALIHLGDIYYSGTSREVQENFLAICQRLLGPQTPIYNLSGNHDMYSGGEGYYWLLDQIGQPASYFCLRNDDWQLLALDTGLHDASPWAVATTHLTYLEDREVAWHRHKIATAGNRKTILLSHHQLFSATSAVGRDSAGQALAVNSRLYEAFHDVLGQVSAWLWGHEHNLTLYEPYLGLARGRCIGAGAVPIRVSEMPYNLATDLVLPAGQANPPQLNTAVQLSHDGESYNHAYALLTLRGPTAEIGYYQMAAEGSSELLFSEQLV
jgi:hypothetical protein